MGAPKNPRPNPYPHKDYLLICAKFIEMVSSGLSLKDSASIAGCSYETIRVWRQNDPEFNEKCFVATADFKRIQIEKIAEAGKKWWAAAAWLLERTFPEEYAQRSTVSLQGNVTSEMVKRLNAGRERAAKAKLAEQLPIEKTESIQ